MRISEKVFARIVIGIRKLIGLCNPKSSYALKSTKVDIELSPITSDLLEVDGKEENMVEFDLDEINNLLFDIKQTRDETSTKMFAKLEELQNEMQELRKLLPRSEN